MEAVSLRWVKSMALCLCFMFWSLVSSLLGASTLGMALGLVAGLLWCLSFATVIHDIFWGGKDDA